MSSAKNTYKQVCAREKTISIFGQDWWLDSVAGEENWDVALVEKGGMIQASMPYVIFRRFGRTTLSMPPLTQTLGPWIRETNAKYTKRLGQQKDLMEKLIDQLPHFGHFSQNWHYSQTNWLPFYWRGFKQTTRYTYIIEGLHDLDRIFDDFESAYRNKVRKAEKLVEVRRGLGIDEFYGINMLTFQRQGMASPYSLEFIRKHDSVLAGKGQREIFFASDGNGSLHSALYLTWDAMSAYVHMVGENPALRNSGAGILLIWEAVKYASEVLGLNRFDFEGSMIEGVERVRRDCGARQIPYFCISKTPSRLLKAKFCLGNLMSGQ